MGHPAVPGLRHLRDLDGGRDQPARRSTCPRPRASWSAGSTPSTPSLKFALFFLAEYVNMVTVSAWPPRCSSAAGAPRGRSRRINDGMFNEGWWPVLWFIVKLWLFMFLFIWLRGTLPRLRYDQFMRFGWKVLIPVALAWSSSSIGVGARRSSCSPTSTCAATWSGGGGDPRDRDRRAAFWPQKAERRGRGRRRRGSTRSPAGTRCRRCRGSSCRPRAAGRPGRRASRRRSAPPRSPRAPRTGWPTPCAPADEPAHRASPPQEDTRG